MTNARGISLVGFMEKVAGTRYLRQVCAFNGDQSDARLEHEWKAANRRIGNPMGRMGMPELMDIPASHREYVQELAQQDWLRHRLSNSLAGAEFKMVEIDPLLAMQFAVNLERSEDLCKKLSEQATEDHLFALCLPHIPPDPEITHYKDSTQVGSMLVMTKNLSLGIVKEGRHEIDTANGHRLLVGIELTVPVPLMHVVRFQDQCYLHNGFHRAYGARMAGITHVPCIFREVTHPTDIGISHDTFSLEALRSPNPPTVGHFTNGRAHEVQLRSLTRVIQVSWSEYTV